MRLFLNGKHRDCCFLSVVKILTELVIMHSIKQLCDAVRETAYAIHLYFGHGHFEKIYENSLVHRLRKSGKEVKQQFELRVFDEDGTELGDFKADILLENRLLIEAKACRSLTNEHSAQILGYMRAAKIEHGLLINFGSYRFQIKKFILSSEFLNGRDEPC